MLKTSLVLVLATLLSCASAVPPPPAYQTMRGQTCGRDCQSRYAACMQNELRPDYLLMSPRKRACGKMLRECHDGCLEGERM